MAENEPSDEEKIEITKKLNEIADALIAKSAETNGIQMPDLEKMRTKISLMLENEDEMKLFKYTLFLYAALKMTIMQDIVEKSTVKKSDEK